MDETESVPLTGRDALDGFEKILKSQAERGLHILAFDQSAEQFETPLHRPTSLKSVAESREPVAHDFQLQLNQITAYRIAQLNVSL